MYYPILKGLQTGFPAHRNLIFHGVLISLSWNINRDNNVLVFPCISMIKYVAIRKILKNSK